MCRLLSGDTLINRSFSIFRVLQVRPGGFPACARPTRGSLRPCVARAQKIIRLHPVPVLGAQEQRGCFPAPLSFSVSSNGRGESGGFPTFARPLRAFWFFIFYRGSRQTVLHCAHRATTVLSWGLCEQEGWLSAPSQPTVLAESAVQVLIPALPNSLR